MNEKYTSLAKNTIIFAIGSIGSKLILFLLVPLYTNCMSTEEYGTADLVFTVGQILIPFLSAGIFSGVIRFGISKDTRHEDVLRNALLIISGGSVVMLIIAPLIGLYGALTEWKWFLSAYVITDLFASVELNYLKAKEQNKRYTAVGLIRTLALALLNILFLVVLKTGVSGYLLSTIFSSVLAIVISAFWGNLFRDFSHSRKNTILLREMLSYSAPLILNGISWWVIHSSDKIMIEVMIGASALGIYSIAGKIPSVINVIVSIFSQAWDISSIKEIESSSDTSFFDDIFGVYSFLVFFVTLIASMITKPFMQIYVGVEFRDAWVYVPLLLVSAAYGAIGSFFASFFGALKKSGLSMWSTLLGAVINIILNLIFIPFIGIWGAIVGTVASYTAIALFRMFAVLHFIPIRFSYVKYFTNFTLVILQAILISIGFNTWLVSIACLFVFTCINYKNGLAFAKRVKVFLYKRL